MSAALHQICIIFFGILAGFLFRKAKLLSADSTSVLSGIVVNLVLPFFLFSSILNSGVTVRSSSVFLAALCGMILYLLRVPVPDVLVDGCAFIGQATSSCAMLIIGSALAEVPLRELFDDWRIIPYLFLRLAGLGVLMLVLLKPFHIDPVLHGVLVLMASMPAATNSTMLCHIYGGNRSLSAKLIFLSTAFSAVTIPIWSAICFQ